MQGAFAEHVRALEASGAKTRLVKTPDDLRDLEGLVLPGGESMTMTMLMERVGLLEPLRAAIATGLPTLATCAGMIVLAREVTDGMAGQRGLGLLDISVRRNGYGRQVDSFEGRRCGGPRRQAFSRSVHSVTARGVGRHRRGGRDA